MGVELGRFGVWQHESRISPELAVELEKLGYGAIWLGGSPPGDLNAAEALLDATTSITLATGIVNIWQVEAATVAESYHRIAAKHPDRFLLGVGAGHPEQDKAFVKPYGALVEYLDALDATGVPVEARALAALGPKVLKLAGFRPVACLPGAGRGPSLKRTAVGTFQPTSYDSAERCPVPFEEE